MKRGSARRNAGINRVGEPPKGPQSSPSPPSSPLVTQLRDMKVFVVLSLAFAMASAGDKEYMKLKKWAFHKAIEGCIGEEAAKLYMIKVKTSVAECMQIDAPELELPMFKAPYRAVGALVDAAFNPPNPAPYAGGNPEPPQRDYLTEAMKKVFFKKMVEQILSEEYDEEDGDDLDGPEQLGFFNSFKKGHRRRHRYTRQVSSQKKEMFELGDRLNAKLQAAKAKMEAEIGNYTCVLRKCGVVDSSNELAGERELLAMFEKFPLPGDNGDRWLRNHMEKGVKNCKAFAESIPKEMLDDCPYGPSLGKVKAFKKCMKMHKIRTCMNFDIKQKLEQNVDGGLDQLVETTQLDESELLPLVMTLLHGPEPDL